jgi:predicted nucleotidyltransferase
MQRTLLQRRDEQRKLRRLELWEQARLQLRGLLAELLPGKRVFVFGSLAKRGAFNDASDVDIALLEEPEEMSIFGLQGLLEERMRRPVDVVLLNECRFKEKVLREGEEWML